MRRPPRGGHGYGAAPTTRGEVPLLPPCLLCLPCLVLSPVRLPARCCASEWGRAHGQRHQLSAVPLRSSTQRSSAAPCRAPAQPHAAPIPQPRRPGAARRCAHAQPHDVFRAQPHAASLLQPPRPSAANAAPMLSSMLRPLRSRMVRSSAVPRGGLPHPDAAACCAPRATPRSDQARPQAAP